MEVDMDGLMKRLLAPGDMDKCFKGSHGKMDVVSVVVGGGVYRQKTVAAHFRVYRDDKHTVSASMEKVIIDSSSQHIAALAAQLAKWIERHLERCVIILDCAGQGTQFGKVLSFELRSYVAGERVIIMSAWGEQCAGESNRKRFYNQRAQCTMDASRAAKDGMLKLPSNYRDELVKQATSIHVHAAPGAEGGERWRVMPKEQMRAEGLGPTDLWDTVCLAFLEGSTGEGKS